MTQASNSTIHQTHYKGPIDCLRQIVAEEGWSRVFTGLKPTMVREAIGVTCWFSAYEAARRWFYQKNDGVHPSGLQVALCGTAGEWAPSAVVDLDLYLHPHWLVSSTPCTWNHQEA
jgi:hypothetical protein